MKEKIGYFTGVAFMGLTLGVFVAIGSKMIDHVFPDEKIVIEHIHKWSVEDLNDSLN